MTRMTIAAQAGTHFPTRGRTALLAHLLEALRLWSERAYQRRMLASADDRLLSDIGRGRAEVVAEAYKPFWRG
jgi:uncharacterized protein YjiS (DUF1127 family)